MPVALVLGGARCVWSDLERARALTAGLDCIIVAVNDAGCEFKGDIDGWASFHPEKLPDWQGKRALRGLNTDYRTFVHKANGWVKAEIAPLEWSGSSGLYAAQVAVRNMGAVGVILCGVPMEAGGGHIARSGDWPLAEKYRPAFEAAKEAGLPVRSMSGWSAGLFGEPDQEWLDDLKVGPPIQRRIPEVSVQIKFIRDRNFTPPEERRITVAYKAGQEYPVKRAWAEAMIADGDAKEVRAPRRDPLDHDNNGRKGGAAPKAD